VYTSALLGLAMIAFLESGNARAATVEGFESTTLDLGNSIGDAGIRTGNFSGQDPTEGTRQLLLTTISSISDIEFTSVSGMNAVAVASVATFLGVSPSSITNGSAAGTEGSAFRLSLGTLTAGTVVTFNYDFLTLETGPLFPRNHLDFAFITLQLGSNTPTVSVISDTTAILFPVVDPGNTGMGKFAFETRYQTFTINITTNGTYTLGVGVMDAGNSTSPNDKGVSSGLLVDNITVTVPEPTTVALGVMGALLLVGLRRRSQASR